MPRFSFVVLWLLPGSLLASEPSFKPLPTLGQGVTRVHAISLDGSVAVGESAGAPFRWTENSGISALSGFPGAATDVSRGGEVVVGHEIPPGSFPKGFRWIDDEEIQRLPDASVGDQSFPRAVSADGWVTVGESHGAVYWLFDGFPIELGVGSNSWAEAASHDGSVILGRSLNPDMPGSFLWESGRVSFLDLPGDAVDMTPDGRVVVGGGSLGGFFWTAETGVTRIGMLPSSISDDGRLVIGALGLNRPALWTESSGPVELQPFLSGLGLDLSGWTLTEVTAISGDGMTIAGRGIPPDPSISGAWIATIPEPSCWLLAGTAFSLGALGIALQRTAALMRRG